MQEHVLFILGNLSRRINTASNYQQKRTNWIIGYWVKNRKDILMEKGNIILSILYSYLFIHNMFMNKKNTCLKCHRLRKIKQSIYYYVYGYISALKFSKGILIYPLFLIFTFCSKILHMLQKLNIKRGNNINIKRNKNHLTTFETSST